MSCSLGSGSRSRTGGLTADGRWAEGTLGVAAGVLRVTPESAGEEQPYRHRSGVVAVFDGRLDNRDELLSALLSNDVTAGDPDVALVAEAYVTWGDRFPERLNGEYALAVLDPTSRRVLLARDVVGTRSLVFGQTPAGDVVFGSEAKALFAHPRVERTEPRRRGRVPPRRERPGDALGQLLRAVRSGAARGDRARRGAGITWRTH